MNEVCAGCAVMMRGGGWIEATIYYRACHKPHDRVRIMSNLEDNVLFDGTSRGLRLLAEAGYVRQSGPGSTTLLTEFPGPRLTP